MSALNPQIAVISVGIKQLREVTIYPLSLADQFKVTDLVISVFNQFSTVTDKKGIKEHELVTQAIKLVEENLQKILGLVTDKSANITFDELSNDQFSDLVILIYETNYEASLKKLQSLGQKIKTLLPKIKA